MNVLVSLPVGQLAVLGRTRYLGVWPEFEPLWHLVILWCSMFRGVVVAVLERP